MSDTAREIWQLATDERTGERFLCYAVAPHYSYDIQIRHIYTPTDAANWLAQIALKTWATDTCLADLCRKFTRLGLMR